MLTALCITNTLGYEGTNFQLFDTQFAIVSDSNSARAFPA